MSAKLRKSLTLALLTLTFGFAGTQVPAAAADEPPPTPPDVSKTTCSTSVLTLVTLDPCKVVGSLQEVAAYGLEDVAKELGKNALEGVNLVNVCALGSHPKPVPASIVNACPVVK